MTKVSIIVPIYNVGKFLKECIESCINQTLKEIEIILVDDESKDDSGKICDEYSKKDKRIKVIHQKNSGVSVARNAGIEIATGKWILFIDGDDWIEANMCEIMYKMAEDNDLDIGLCGYFINEKKNEIKKSFFDKQAESFNSKEDKIKLIKKCFSSFGVPWAKIYRKDFICNNNILFKPKLKRMQDSIFNFYAMEKADNIKYIDTPLYHYRQFGESACYKYSPDFEETAIQIISETDKFISKYKLENELEVEYNDRRIKLFIETVKLKYVLDKSKKKLSEKILEIKRLKNENIYKTMTKDGKYGDLNLNYSIGAFLIKINCMLLLYIYYKIIYIIKRNKKY